MFNKRVYSFINNYQLIENKDQVIVAVSSGPDSMFLLFLLQSLLDKYQFKINVAHVNHHTRGDENTEEYHLIENYCKKNNIPFYSSDFYFDSNENFHEAARVFRYNYFKELANKIGANKIAIAHHEDDQIETILFKISRGNQIGGYLGMKPIYQFAENLSIIRPLLILTKQEIINLCNRYEIPYALDSSNEKNKYTRNYIRNKIVPAFKEIQPDFNQKIIQFQEQLSEAYDYLEQKAIFIYQQMIISKEKDRIILDNHLLKETHISLLRIILLHVFRELSNNELELTYEKIKNIINIINNDKANVNFKLGKNYYCIKEYNFLKFQYEYIEEIGYSIEVNDFGIYNLPNGMKISFKNVQEKAKTHNKSMILCYNSTIWPLVIRTRNNGDSIKTNIGTKKINRIFIDEKIPVNLRNTWPLLENNHEILWVIGLQKSFLKRKDCSEYILIEVL